MKKQFLILFAIICAGLVPGLSGCEKEAPPEEKPALYEDVNPAADTMEAAAGTEEEPAEELPPAGYYAGEDGYLQLFENGTAIQNVAGCNWLTHWDENAIYSEFDSPGEYTYKDGHFSFGWEGGDGYYTYDYVYCPDEMPPLEAEIRRNGESGFFDKLENEPFFEHRENGMLYGFEDDFWDGCSVWCAVREYGLSASASSFLAAQGQYSYEPGHIIENNRSNAWVEGAEGYGIGEYVDIDRSYVVGDEDYGVDFRELCIVNGYARTADAWKANSRVHELKMYFNNEYICTLPLLDTMEPQYFDLLAYQLHAGSGAESTFRFEIASVYPGEKYEDTAITGIEVSIWTPNH